MLESVYLTFKAVRVSVCEVCDNACDMCDDLYGPEFIIWLLCGPNQSLLSDYFSQGEIVFEM